MSDMFAADVRFECSIENDVVEFKVSVANLPEEVIAELTKNMDAVSAAMVKSIFEGSGAGQLLHTIEHTIEHNGFNSLGNKTKGQMN